MKIFVAGKWENRGQVKNFMFDLEWWGHTITYDWTKDEEDQPGFPVRNTTNDLRGVEDADVFVFLAENTEHYEGSLVEMGAALALHKPVDLIGHGADTCIHTNHPLVRHFEDREEYMIHMKRGGR